MGGDTREVFTQGPVVVFRWRNAPGWPVEYASPNAAEVFGYTAQEFMEGDIAYGSLIAPDCVELVGREVQEATESGLASFIHEPYEIRHRDGTPRWLYDATQIIRDDDGQATHYLGYVIDVTLRINTEREKKDLEARLLHSQKLESLGVLAGGVAHDFNNLLTGVLGHAGLALKELAGVDGQPAAEHVRQIERLASKAADLTRQLLAYSGRGRFVVQPLDLGTVVADMSSMLDVVVSKKATFEMTTEPDLPAVLVDQAQIQQIVMNLITNASDALADQVGTIRVCTRRRMLDATVLTASFPGWNLTPGLYVSLEVQDTGVGMSSVTQGRIFDPFFSTKEAGHGLGMSAVDGIVRGHKGGLRIDSVVGQGTTFEVVLPASKQVVAPALELPPEGEWRGQGTVLIVDDQASIRTVASHMLEHFGFQTLCASNGARALELFRSYRRDISLVLLDLTMPVMDGRETLEALRMLSADLPILLSSGYDAASPPEGEFIEGASGFLQKPYRIHEMRAAIQDVLR